MARSPFGGFALLLACALTGPGCQQSDGGRCVMNSDCLSGICSFYGESAMAGRCEAPASLPDASGPAPTQPTDGGNAAVDGGADGSGLDAMKDAMKDAPKADAPSALDGERGDLPAADAESTAPPIVSAWLGS